MMKYQQEDWAIAATPHRISRIELNQICDIADLAREDRQVVKLWIGESDIPTPDFIRQAAKTALDNGQTRYCYALGLPGLREALSRYHRRHWHVDIEAQRFSVTAGGVQAIMQAFQAILEPGDEVIVPVPAWPNLLEIIGILGGKVVPVLYDRGKDGCFHLDLDKLFSMMGPKTRAIAINSPSNPTGWIMPREDMLAVRDFARERGIWIIADEVYTHFTYQNGLAPSFLEMTEPTDRLLVTNTFSKNWCMTGWRMGWIVYPQGLATIFDNLSQYNTTGVPTFNQHAGIVALDQGDDFIRQMVERAREGRDIICSALAHLPNVQLFWPQGTFYCFFAIDGMEHSYDMAKRILRHAQVGVAPGSAFGPGGENFLRVCFAVDKALMLEGAQRLGEFLRNI